MSFAFGREESKLAGRKRKAPAKPCKRKQTNRLVEVPFVARYDHCLQFSVSLLQCHTFVLRGLLVCLQQAPRGVRSVRYFPYQSIRLSNIDPPLVLIARASVIEIAMKAHLTANASDPEKEFALNYFPETKAYMLSAINNGVHP